MGEIIDEEHWIENIRTVIGLQRECGLFVFDTWMDGDGGDGEFSFTSLADSNP